MRTVQSHQIHLIRGFSLLIKMVSFSPTKTFTYVEVLSSLLAAICSLLLPSFHLVPFTSPSYSHWHCGNWRQKQAADSEASQLKLQSCRCSTLFSRDDMRTSLRRSNNPNMCTILPRHRQRGKKVPIKAPRSHRLAREARLITSS